MASMASLRKMAHNEYFELSLYCEIVYLGKSLHEVCSKTVTFLCIGMQQTNTVKCIHM